MTPPSDSDRTRILQRRAAFLTSALTALGCSAQPPQPETQPDTKPTVALPDPPPPEPDPTATAESPPPPPTAGPVGEPPSLDIPDDVGEVAKRNFESFAKSMTKVYALYDEMDGIVAKECDILTAACDAQWQKLAELEIDMARVTMVLPRCPGSSDDAKRFAAFQKTHDDYRGRRRAQLDGRIHQVLQPGGAAAKQRLEEHRQKARAAHPIPCLSFACEDW